MRPLFLSGATLLLLSAVSAGAQETRTLDLSVASRYDTVQLNPGRYRFRVKNLSPKYEYTIRTSEGREAIPPIPAPTGTPLRIASEECQKLTFANKALRDAAKEEDVPSLVNDTQDALQAERSDTTCKAYVKTADSLLLRTEHNVDDVFDLVAGSYVVLDVARIEKDTAARKWQRRYTSGPLGEWHPTYGYAFPVFVHGAQRYFLKQIGDSGSRYLISEERRTRQFDAVPTLMFAYEPAQSSRFEGHLLLAGFAADLTKPSLYLGFGGTYYSNLVIAIGVVARQEQVLMGQYRVGDTVRTNLTQEQLMRDEFRARPFLSVTLRFDKNPFKADSASGAQTTGEKAKKGAANNGSGSTTPKGDSTSKTGEKQKKDQSKAGDARSLFFIGADEQDKRAH